MSWDRKQRGAAGGYFYRCVRRNGKPRKVYMGRGPGAEAAAAANERSRLARQTIQEQQRAEQLRMTFADLALQDLRVLLNVLVKAILVVHGYHEHHGEWRRRRDRADES